MPAYYNEVESYAAQWLRNLIDAGEIAPGDVDERDIRDVKPDDLRGYDQCHFFAGIGVWSYALRRAGVPDDAPVWTGSCPCQPFSSAGRRKGAADERHLWPHWHHLIRVCRPGLVWGEQVASKDGLAWLDLVQADMEGVDYALWPVVVPAAGVGAPHERSRQFFTAYDLRLAADGLGHADHEGLEGYTWDGDEPGGRAHPARPTPSTGRPGVVVDANRARLEGHPRSGQEPCSRDQHAGTSGFGDMAHDTAGGVGGGPRPTNGFWGYADWLLCRDPNGPRWRPVEPGTFPMAYGPPALMGRCGAYGNAIVAPLAEAVIRSSIEAVRDTLAAGGPRGGGDAGLEPDPEVEAMLA